MTTETKKVEITPIVFEYSENKESLKELLGHVTIEYQRIGKRNHFIDEKEEREQLNIIISKNNTKINFKYGLSLISTAWLYASPKEQSFLTAYRMNSPFNKFGYPEGRYQQYTIINREIGKIWENLAYNILACIKCDYYCSIDFEEFCEEFGYSSDSIKAKATWENCLKQSSKLQRMFTEDEVECLPS